MHTSCSENTVQSKVEYYSVIMRRTSPKRALCREDREFDQEAVYRFEVPRESVDWADEKRAAHALDCFHGSIPVSEPEHFSFQVLWSDGREICED